MSGFDGRGRSRGGRGEGRGRGYGGRSSRLNGSSPYGAPNLPLHKFAGRRVYVNNLSWNTSWHGLKDHFKGAGNVIRADVMEDHETGRSKGCGLVEFATKEEAARAIDMFNDTELDDRQIQVREDRETTGLDEPEVTGRRMYVQNLSWNVNWRILKTHFSQAGTVLRADVLEDTKTGRSKGCGVVEMSSREEAEAATAMLNASELDGRKIYIREDRDAPGNETSRFILSRLDDAPDSALRSSRPAKSNGVIGDARPAVTTESPRVYVGNLSYQVSDEELEECMKTAGPVLSSQVVMGDDGRSKGYGLVEFQNALAAQQAIMILNNHELLGRQIFLREDRE